MKNLYRLLCCLLLCFSTTSFAVSTQWQTIAPGIDYTKLNIPSSINGKLHAFKINLKQNQLKLILAKDHHMERSSASELAMLNNAVIAINGGFFSPESKPLGLRIQNGQVLSPIKNTSWWGVFYIRNGKPYIVSQKQFKASSSRAINFAIQAGPRLIVNNKITQLKGKLAQRTALCINQKKQVIIVATDQAFISTTTLAEIMATPITSGGLGCSNALNLDGGSSTQLYTNFPGLHLNIANFNLVTDVVAVVPKT